nr:MAG TPA_asm: hypothetical protein [Caudoviricetes sp.]
MEGVGTTPPPCLLTRMFLRRYFRSICPLA